MEQRVSTGRLEVSLAVSGLKDLNGRTVKIDRVEVQGEPWDFKDSDGKRVTIPKMDITIDGNIYGIAHILVPKCQDIDGKPIPVRGNQVTVPYPTEGKVIEVPKKDGTSYVLQFSEKSSAFA